MITLLANGFQVRLAESSSVGFDILHPAFSEGFQGGGYSFPIEIENNDENNMALGFPSSLHRIESEFKTNVQIFYKGHFWKKGILIIERPGTKKHSGYLRTGIQSFNVLDKKLSEVNYGGPVILGADAEEVLEYVKDTVKTYFRWHDRGFFFPVTYNPNFYEEKNALFSGFINRWNPSTESFNENYLDGSVVHNEDCLSPFPYVLFVLRKIFEEEGYRLPDDAVDNYPDSGLDKMLFYGRSSLDELATPHFAVNVGHEDDIEYPLIDSSTADRIHYIKDVDPPYSDPDGVWNVDDYEYAIQVAGLHEIDMDITFTFNNPRSGSLHWARTVYLVLKMDSTTISTGGVPGTYVTGADLIPGQTYTLRMRLTPSFVSGDIGKKVYPLIACPHFYWDQNISVSGGKITIRALENSSVNEYSKTLNLQNHVPDMTVRELLSELRVLRGVEFIPNEATKTIHIKMHPDFFVNQPEDITNKSQVDHSATNNEDSVRLIGYEWPSDDELIENSFRDYDKSLIADEVGSFEDLPTPTILGQNILVLDQNVRYVTADDGSGTLEWQYLRVDYDDQYIDVHAHVDRRSKICPIFMTRIEDYYGNSVVMPHILQEGKSIPFGIDGSGNSPRYMYAVYELPQWDSDPSTWYPFATTQPTLAGESTGNIGSKFIIDPDGEPLQLLIEHWEMIRLKKTKYLWDKDLDLTFADIANLEDIERGIFEIKMLDRIQLLIKQVSVSLGKNIELSKIQFLRREP